MRTFGRASRYRSTLASHRAKRRQRFLCAFLHFAQRNFWAARMRASAPGDNFRRCPVRALPGKRRAAIAFPIFSNSPLRRVRSCSRAASTGVRFVMGKILSGLPVTIADGEDFAPCCKDVCNREAGARRRHLRSDNRPSCRRYFYHRKRGCARNLKAALNKTAGA